jgi:hypothetical protein
MVTKTEQCMLVCMPWERRPEDIEHLKRECFICHGYVCVNALQTFGASSVPPNYLPICGGCMLDLLDADPEESKFQMTDAQKRDPRIQAIEQIHKTEWPLKAVEMVRKNRHLYDARPGAAQGRDN